MSNYLKSQYQSLPDVNAPVRAIVKRTDDPKGEGRIGVIVPRIMPYIDPNSRSNPKDTNKSIDKSFLQNEEVKDLIGSNVSESPFIWARRTTREFDIPYVNSAVYVYFEDGDWQKCYYLPYGPTVSGEGGKQNATIDTAMDQYDPSKKPLIREIGTFKDGTVIYYNENGGNKGFHIKMPSGFEFSIAENETVQGILMKTATGFGINVDQLNKSISAYTQAGHKLVMADGGDDGGKKITLTSSAGHMIEVNDDDNKISSITAGGQSIVADDGGGTIELKNSGGAVMKLDGPRVMMN